MHKVRVVLDRLSTEEISRGNLFVKDRLGDVDPWSEELNHFFMLLLRRRVFLDNEVLRNGVIWPHIISLLKSDLNQGVSRSSTLIILKIFLHFVFWKIDLFGSSERFG